MRFSAIFAAAALLTAGAAAHADSFFVCPAGGCAVTVSEGLGPDNGFNTTAGNPYQRLQHGKRDVHVHGRTGLQQ